MKTLGLIGGMSWESTALYYGQLNKGIGERLGGLHSAKMMMANVDFQEIVDLQRTGQWTKAGAILADCAARLQSAGAEGVALAVNTMHKVAPQIVACLDIPFIDIRDAIAAELKANGIGVSGLLGTGYVMEDEFYRVHIEKAAQCKIVVPKEQGASTLNHIIYGELSKGVVTDVSKSKVAGLIGELQAAGAEGVILGCTELPMLQLDRMCPVPLFDSTALHVKACLDFMTG